MNRKESAVAAFKQGYSCSQAVLSAYAETLGLDRNTALRVAAGFGGGMGRLAETCGAVTGAIMVLGLRYGSTLADDKPAKEKTYQSVRDFISRFKACHGSVTCRELLGCDISTAEGFRQAMDQRLTTTFCPKLVESAAEILEGLL